MQDASNALLDTDVCLEKLSFCWYKSFSFFAEVVMKSRDLLTALGCVVSKNFNDVDYQYLLGGMRSGAKTFTHNT